MYRKYQIYISTLGHIGNTIYIYISTCSYISTCRYISISVDIHIGNTWNEAAPLRAYIDENRDCTSLESGCDTPRFFGRIHETHEPMYARRLHHAGSRRWVRRSTRASEKWLQLRSTRW
jgi:hypothetical protein